MRRYLEEAVWRPGRGPGPDLLRRLLWPPSLLYGAASRLRNLAYDQGWRTAERAPIPVLSVGGIEVGGVGKTPLCLELARLAMEAGRRPAIVTRGYGRRAEPGEEAAVRVAPGQGSSDWEDFGDEPVFLAEGAPGCQVWVSSRRIDGARAAAAAGADLAILDDGFQHRSLARDLDVLCLDPDAPLGNGMLLPAGPLREAPGPAMRRADRIVLSDGGPEPCAATAGALQAGLSASTDIFSWRGESVLEIALGAPPQEGEALCLLAGIARPGRLGPSLGVLGHPVVRSFLFPDHHPYTRQDLDGVLRLRPDPSTLLVTTEKDWIRLRGLARSSGARWALLRRRLVWNEPGAEESWKETLQSL